VRTPRVVTRPEIDDVAVRARKSAGSGPVKCPAPRSDGTRARRAPRDDGLESCEQARRPRRATEAGRASRAAAPRHRESQARRGQAGRNRRAPARGSSLPPARAPTRPLRRAARAIQLWRRVQRMSGSNCASGRDGRGESGGAARSPGKERRRGPARKRRRRRAGEEHEIRRARARSSIPSARAPTRSWRRTACIARMTRRPRGEADAHLPRFLNPDGMRAHAARDDGLELREWARRPRPDEAKPRTRGKTAPHAPTASCASWASPRATTAPPWRAERE